MFIVVGFNNGVIVVVVAVADDDDIFVLEDLEIVWRVEQDNDSWIVWQWI